MHHVAMVSQGFAQFGGQHTAAAVGGVTDNTYPHLLTLRELQNPRQLVQAKVLNGTLPEGPELPGSPGCDVELTELLKAECLFLGFKYRPMPKKLLFTLLFVLLLGGAAAYLYVKVPYAEGTRSGRLMDLSGPAGWPKHWNGQLRSVPVAGLSGLAGGGTFSFFVRRQSLADSLSKLLGTQLVLHYRTFSGHLPLHGGSRHEVDRILFENTEGPVQGR